MKINELYLSIPPHISVCWREVSFIAMNGDDLKIQLKNGKVVSIPCLPEDVLKNIFAFHALHIEQEYIPLPPLPLGKLPPNPFQFDPQDLLDIPVAFKIGTPDGVISALAHNPIQSQAKPLPPELLDKIVSITKSLGMNFDNLPQGESSCRCYFCQIMNHIQLQKFIEQEVTEEDLKFHEWNIKKTGDNLYSVENPLNHTEKYSVFLGHPVGCSCGKEGCEHLIAVLKS